MAARTGRARRRRTADAGSACVTWCGPAKRRTGAVCAGRPTAKTSAGSCSVAPSASATRTAWESLFTLYRGLVASWVRQHPASDSVTERDDCVNLVFERFWVAVGPQRFAEFPSAAALLKYLKMCVHTVLIDEVRARRVTQRTLAAWPAGETLAVGGDVGVTATARLADDELWELVSREVTDEGERLLLYLTVGLDLSPRQIHARYPRVFGSVRDVYRIKRNVLDRLRRNQTVRRHLAPV